jgi:hypothetical protein
MNGSDAKMACGLRDGAGARVSTISRSFRNNRQSHLFGIANGGWLMIAASRSSPSSTLRYSSAEVPRVMIRGYVSCIKANTSGSSPDNAD